MDFFRRHWFLLALGLMIAVGFGWARALAWLPEVPRLSDLLVALTMFLMGWPLRFGDLRDNLRRPGPAILASLINLGLFPLVAWPLSKLLGGEMGAGLIVLSATPCTLASASVWTRRAGGNDIISMLVTIATNSACFLVTPGWILLLTGNQVPRELALQIVLTLILVVLVPLVLAQVSRGIPAVAQWATTRKTLLSVLAQIGLLGVVLIGCIKSGNKMLDQEQAWDWAEFGLLTLLLGVLHLAAWWYGLWQARRFGWPLADAAAVAFSGSQKTLMVGVVAAIRLEFSVLPLIVYHALQLLLDTVLADRLRRRIGKGD
jgi:sodium/bile acid cotransporter 7